MTPIIKPDCLHPAISKVCSSARGSMKKPPQCCQFHALQHSLLLLLEWKTPQPGNISHYSKVAFNKHFYRHRLPGADYKGSIFTDCWYINSSGFVYISGSPNCLWFLAGKSLLTSLPWIPEGFYMSTVCQGEARNTRIRCFMDPFQLL